MNNKSRKAAELMALSMALCMPQWHPDAFRDITPVLAVPPQPKGCRICGAACPPKRVCCSAEHWKEYGLRAQEVSK